MDKSRSLSKFIRIFYLLIICLLMYGINFYFYIGKEIGEDLKYFSKTLNSIFDILLIIIPACYFFTKITDKKKFNLIVLCAYILNITLLIIFIENPEYTKKIQEKQQDTRKKEYYAQLFKQADKIYQCDDSYRVVKILNPYKEYHLLQEGDIKFSYYRTSFAKEINGAVYYNNIFNVNTLEQIKELKKILATCDIPKEDDYRYLIK